MTAPDPQIMRELATEHILDDARRAHDIGAAVLGHFGPDALTKPEYHAYCDAIRDAIKTATIAISWPDETGQDALNAAYRERAHLVALLAAVYPAQFRENPDEDYEDWPILYVQLPTGQASWHISPRDTDLFPHVKFGTEAEWDGHTTDEKYARIRHLTAQTHAANKRGAENAQALEPLLAFGRHIANAARPDPIRDFKAASDRFQQALTAAAELTTHAEHLAAIDTAIEDYNRAVDAYNADAELYNRAHGLTEDDDAAETLRHLVRNDDTAALVDAEVETAVHGLLGELGQRARDEKTGNR